MVVLLVCGDKTTQKEDIADAKFYWADYRGRKSLATNKEGKLSMAKLLRSLKQK